MQSPEGSSREIFLIVSHVKTVDTNDPLLWQQTGETHIFARRKQSERASPFFCYGIQGGLLRPLSAG